MDLRASPLLCLVRRDDEIPYDVLRQDLTFGAGEHLQEVEPSEEVRIVNELAAIWRAGGRLRASFNVQDALERVHIFPCGPGRVQLPLGDGSLTDINEFRERRLRQL